MRLKKLLIVFVLLTISFASFAEFQWGRYDHRYVTYRPDGPDVDIIPCHRPGKQFRFYKFCIYSNRNKAERCAKSLQKQGAEIYYHHMGDTDYYEDYIYGTCWYMSLGPGWTNQGHLKDIIEASYGFQRWIY